MLDETAHGNEFAFSCLFDELGTQTYTVSMRILGCRGKADLATLQTWLWVWQNAAALNQTSSSAREKILTVAFDISSSVKLTE
ncbi:hypothetical protein D6T64_02105 [Cryobacterium melibiosiphilum]|uniref:Uncharacterized protein n=1 Tax=Cryobacterium melibiosiphilum TaxID=995039 RepID=A0A3A5MMI3_9MICO|nr:hypothetical protein [Cryobacterium melibiosiphilum]RJT91310.1 hypothetical protein D6T64_02105 [Cryobacterium melibiosiphilum]